MDLFQQIVMGIIQGITEWIPISSKSMLLLVSTNFFGGVDVELFLRQALLLHLGTFFAALIYFRKDVAQLIKAAFNYKRSDRETRNVLNFLAISTIISGFVGLAFLQFFKFLSDQTQLIVTSKIITFSIGALLLITGFIQIRASKSGGNRTILHLNQTDNILLGVAQGFAALPGISRSGITISTLLFRNIDDKTAVRLSFLMSMPIVLAGNILLNFKDFNLISGLFVGILVAFVFGLITINIIMKIAERIRFGWFVILMAILIILAGFLI